MLPDIEAEFVLKCTVCGVKVEITGVPTDAKKRGETFQRIFTAIDERFGDGNGELSESEFRNFMERVSPSCTNDDCAKVFAWIDADGSKQLSFAEFLDWLEAIVTLFYGRYKRKM